MIPHLIAQAGADLEFLLDLASRLGVVGLLLIIVVGGARKKPWWVFSWVYEDLKGRHELLRQERDQWKEIALRATNLAQIMDSLRKERR